MNLIVINITLNESVYRIFSTFVYYLRWIYVQSALSNSSSLGNRKNIRITKSSHYCNCIAYSISSVAEARDRALSFSREAEFMRWFPVAFLTNGVLKVTHGGI